MRRAALAAVPWLCSNRAIAAQAAFITRVLHHSAIPAASACSSSGLGQARRRAAASQPAPGLVKSASLLGGGEPRWQRSNVALVVVSGRVPALQGGGRGLLVLAGMRCRHSARSGVDREPVARAQASRATCARPRGPCSAPAPAAGCDWAPAITGHVSGLGGGLPPPPPAAAAANLPYALNYWIAGSSPSSTRWAWVSCMSAAAAYMHTRLRPPTFVRPPACSPPARVSCWLVLPALLRLTGWLLLLLLPPCSQQECQDPVPWAGQCRQDDADAHAEGRVSGCCLLLCSGCVLV